MKKLALAALFTAVWLVPAQVSGAHHSPYNIKPPKHPKPYPIACHTVTDGFYATGNLISATLTPVAHRRFDGSITVSVRRANHRAPTGSQTYPLTNARVYLHHRLSPTALPAGSRVQLSGTITEQPRRCRTAGFTPTITVRKVDIRRAHHARRDQNRQH